MRQCNNLTESLNDEGSNEEEDDGTTCNNLEDLLDRTDGEMG